MSDSWARRSKGWVLLAWAGATALAIAAGVLSAANGRPPELYLALTASGLVYAAAGAIAALRQPRNAIGWMLILQAVLVSALVTLRHALPVTLPLSIAFGTQATVLPLVFVLLTFPSGRIADRASKWLLGSAVIGASIAGVLELLTFEPQSALPAEACSPCTSNPLRLLDPALYPVLQNINAVVFIGFATAVIVLVVMRWRRSRGLTRSALSPVIAGGAILALLYVVLFALALTTRDLPAFASPLLLVTRLLIPIGLVALLLRFYSARAAVARALLRIGRGATIEVIEEALRTSLGDPAVAVGRWSPAARDFIDRSGKHLDLTGIANDQTILRVGDDARPIAAVVHDATLQADDELLAVVAESVEHALDVADLRDDLTARGGDISRLPTGRVTLLFGDIEQSTMLLARLGERWAEVLETFRSHVRTCAQSNDGEIVDLRADECFAAFVSPADALAAARMLLDRLEAVSWPDDASVRVRIGLHTGEPELTPSGYVGLDVHRAARVMAQAHGGQIVVSESFHSAISGHLPVSTELRPLGEIRLRGFETSEALFEAVSSV